jgi:hypothetical protein
VKEVSATKGTSSGTAEKMITNPSKYGEVLHKIKKLNDHLTSDKDFDKLARDHEIDVRKKLNKLGMDSEFDAVNITKYAKEGAEGSG